MFWWAPFLEPQLYEFKRVTRLASSDHWFTVELDRCHRKFYSNSFFPHTSRLWISLSASCHKANNLKKLNMKHQSPSFVLLIPVLLRSSLRYFHFVSLSVAPYVLVVFSTRLGWNDWMKYMFHTQKMLFNWDTRGSNSCSKQ